jgi:hypothetical protein
MSTTISLDTATSSGPPAAKFTAPGAYVVVGIVNVGDYQQRDFDTREPLTWDDGKPKMGKVVTGLVVSAEGVVTGGDWRADYADGTPVEPGDLISFFCEKGMWFTYRDAVKESGGINVGDVARWERIADEPPTKKGAAPQKVHKARIRRPEAKDGDLADRCVAAYHDQASRPALDSAPHEAPVATEAAPF